MKRGYRTSAPDRRVLPPMVHFPETPFHMDRPGTARKLLECAGNKAISLMLIRVTGVPFAQVQQDRQGHGYTKDQQSNNGNPP